MARLKILLCVLSLSAVTALAQNVLPSSQAVPIPAQSDPPVTQIRKSVVFIKMHCADAGQKFEVKGTGFFVLYPDARLGADRGFLYLVTNRHMAECWNDAGRPMQVDDISLTLNRKNSGSDSSAEEVLLNRQGNVPWITPVDRSIDLAVLQIGVDAAHFDYKAIPTTWFASNAFLKEHRIVEGEPVFFSGFFSQFPGSTRMEPIVRQGIIAMMPSDKVPFVGMAEKVYLADLHAFHGNSGSPVLFNLSGFRDGNLSFGGGYRLLGVLNGELSEDENFNLELTATLKGKASANSGVSTIVPAEELQDLLDNPRIKNDRDNAVKAEESFNADKAK